MAVRHRLLLDVVPKMDADLVFYHHFQKTSEKITQLPNFWVFRSFSTYYSVALQVLFNKIHLQILFPSTTNWTFWFFKKLPNLVEIGESNRSTRDRR